MNESNCSQSWLVAAVRDGRVTGAERASFERHVAGCDSCRERSRSMHASLEKLQQLPAGLPDAFTLRRERRALLQAFDSSLLASSGLASRWRLGLWFAVASGVLLAAALLLHSSAQRASWVEVAAGPNASWSEKRTGNRDDLSLRNGRFHLGIRRPSAASRVTIALPDGEIEDLGTELVVWVDGDRTSYVAVDRGSVVLRLHGLPQTTLSAGEHWERPSDVAKPVPTSPTSHADADRRVDESPTRPTAQQYAKPPKKAGTVAEPTIAQRPVVDPGAAQMASEDVDYLRVLELLGAGQRDEARAAANQYLNKYPRGLRRLEALGVATRPSR